MGRKADGAPPASGDSGRAVPSAPDELRVVCVASDGTDDVRTVLSEQCAAPDAPDGACAAHDAPGPAAVQNLPVSDASGGASRVRVGKLAIAAEAAALASVPCVLAACAALGLDQTALLSMACVVVALGLFFAGYEHSRPRLRDTMPVAVLAALAAAGRILFAPFPDIKPVSAIAIIAGAAFGRHSGFMVGALAALASNFFFGQGAWTPWQMYAWGMVGWGAGVMAQAGLFERFPRLVYPYGFVAAFGYGFILNMWTILGFFHTGVQASALAVYAAALPFDAAHAVATVVFLLALYAPWTRKLARVKRKYGLISS